MNGKLEKDVQNLQRVEETKPHTKGLFILAERRGETEQWLLLRAELEQPTLVNENTDKTFERGEKKLELWSCRVPVSLGTS